MGTTVKVEKYLQNLPVRRQAAEKMATKMLAKVKRMLQAYALARPHLRLSLKILKAKDRKGDWMYLTSGALSASRLEASFHAATDIFGKKLTSQCDSTSSSWSAGGEQIDKDASEAPGHCSRRDGIYTIEATVAKRECGTFSLTVWKLQRCLLTKSLLRWLSIEQYRPLPISRLETVVMRKGNFETDHVVIQIPLALCYL